MIETRPNLHRSWYDYDWDWALISLLALVLLAGIVLWIYADHPQTAQVSRFSQIDLLLQAGLILNRISKCSCETYGKRARIGSELVLGFRASLRVFDGDLYNEFSTTNILLGPRNLCSHVILVERCNFDVHTFCHSRSLPDVTSGAVLRYISNAI
jgi:hypothetical protein